MTVLRDGATVTEKVTLSSNPEVGPQGFLGIGAVQRPVAPFDISIALERIGGPSAGLDVHPRHHRQADRAEDLTGGTFIAGTGTIDPNGTVGPIGGVLLKLITARDAGATVFLVPADNCAEAVTQIPDGLQLVKVSSLDDAMAALETSEGGRHTARLLTSRPRSVRPVQLNVECRTSSRFGARSPPRSGASSFSPRIRIRQAPPTPSRARRRPALPRPGRGVRRPVRPLDRGSSESVSAASGGSTTISWTRTQPATSSGQDTWASASDSSPLGQGVLGDRGVDGRAQ